MRKIRLIIILIYGLVIALIILLTIIFVARTFVKGSDLYFKETMPKEETKIPPLLEINEMIKILKELKII